MDSTQARRFFEDYLKTFYIERAPERMDPFYTPSVVVHPRPPGVPEGLVGVKMMMQGGLDAFSDTSFTLEAFVYDQGRAAARIVFTGVHTGPFLGIPPTGRPVKVINHAFFQLENGKIVEQWDLPDMMAMTQQLSESAGAAQAA